MRNQFYKKLKGCFILLLSFTVVQTMKAQNVSMPKIFGSNMVLQQDTKVPVWGWGKPGDKIKLSSSWGKVAETLVATDGSWRTNVETPKAKPGEAPVYTLSVNGPKNKITFSNVLIGEVWLCTGQSNMEYSMAKIGKKTDAKAYEQEVADADYPNIRLFNVQKDSAQTPQVDTKGSWELCTPKRIRSFSAVAYYFGREIYNNPNINVPIGLIQDAFSGSGIQCWTKRDVLAADPELKAEYLDKPESSIHRKPSVFYNAMISPVISFAIKGAIWYQGETNVGTPDLYKKANTDMINDWRKDWGRDFSFYAVQMTPRFYKEKQKNDVSFFRGYFREAQDGIMELPKTGIVVTSDLMLNADERSDSHPFNKKDVGVRLAKWALAKDYGQDIQYRGPVYASLNIEGSKAVVGFKKETIGNGLTTKNGEAVKCFKVAGVDQKFYPANAVIKGDKIIVSSPNVEKPVAVRYAFTDGAMSNLQNEEGLAAHPFRTDEWKVGKAVDVPSSDVNKIIK